MNAVHGAGALALAAVSAAMGWALHVPDIPPAVVPVAAPAAATDGPSQRLSVMAWPQPAREARADTEADAGDGAAVRLHEDGSASVEVRHRPAQWIVDELCRLGAPLRPGACGGAAAPAAGDAAGARLLQVLREGSEAQRYDALVQSRTAGVMVAEDELMRLMADGPSERVRLSAFDSYIELKSGDVDQLRTGLQALLRIPHTQLQARAREQLDGIEHLYEQSAALQQLPRQP
jgi:hypothetical protein